MTNIEWLILARDAVNDHEPEMAVKYINEVIERLKTGYEDFEGQEKGMSKNWPEKMQGEDCYRYSSHYVNGFNNCHDAFMAVINQPSQNKVCEHEWIEIFNNGKLIRYDCRFCPVSKPTQIRGDLSEPTWPCRECGKKMTKAEGGTTFTVCEVCWDKHNSSKPIDSPKPMTPLDWFLTPNPLLGNVSPVEMIKDGRLGKLCAWIVNQIEENWDLVGPKQTDLDKSSIAKILDDVPISPVHRAKLFKELCRYIQQTGLMAITKDALENLAKKFYPQEEAELFNTECFIDAVCSAFGQTNLGKVVSVEELMPIVDSELNLHLYTAQVSRRDLASSIHQLLMKGESNV